MSTKAKKKKDCKDFVSFSCQGKGLHGFIVNGEFSAENIFTCKQAQPIRVHITTMLYYLMVRMH